MTQIDFLAIGDITSDAFIKIKNAEVECEMDKENCKLCFGFGDKIPYESLTVIPATGNSSNAAMSASKLGLKTSIITYIGDDKNGDECLKDLAKNNIDTSYIKKENGKHTNYNFVLWYNVDRTILVRHEQFSYSLDKIESPKWIYLSSVGENSIDFHNQIADFIENNPETKLAFQPGTFQIKTGKEMLSKIYKNTEIFFCNVEEAQHILGTETRDLKELLSNISALGPKKVVITDSIDGAYAFDGENFWFVPSYPGDPFERTGAGDAFASTIVASLILGKPLEEALLWGPVNSMSVVKYIGAQEGLLTQEQIVDYLGKAPEDYKIKKI